MSVPVLIISYSRITNVLKLIDALHHQGVAKIYLAIDGPRENDDFLQSQIEVKARSRSIELNIELNVWRRDSNLGPAVSVITAIDWLFSHEERGVILEDDLVLSSDAIRYFDHSLTVFSDLKSVFLITGSNYLENPSLSTAPLLATHYPIIWGWATWNDRWQNYRDALNTLNTLSTPITPHERWFWKNGLRRCLNGVKDAWDIPLVTYQLSRRYLSVMPQNNLISNCGADEFAGNTLVDVWPLNLPLGRMSRYELSRLQSFDGVFDQQLIEQIDSFFKERIYKISKFKVLPPGISTLLDLIRYPSIKRNQKLLKRITQVNRP